MNTKMTPTGSAESQAYAEFGSMVFEHIKECVGDGFRDCDIEFMSELAVKAGLMVYEPYDPVRHNMDLSGHDIEPGDMIYYWGKPSTQRQRSAGPRTKKDATMTNDNQQPLTAVSAGPPCSPFLVLVGSQVEAECASLDLAIESAREIKDQRIRDGGWVFDEPVHVVKIIETFNDQSR